MAAHGKDRPAFQGIKTPRVLDGFSAHSPCFREKICRMRLGEFFPGPAKE